MRVGLPIHQHNRVNTSFQWKPMKYSISFPTIGRNFHLAPEVQLHPNSLYYTTMQSY